MAASSALTSRGRGPPWGRKWVPKKVALEPRGFWCHSGRRKFQSDIDRANDLALTRWLIIYATWEDLVRRPGKILSQLEDALA
ncbi:MAG: hypothetical protein QOH66_2867 [Actinomycetota bacterium]|nr:hypothetical protein [Actinomycetota bacterium]